MLVRSHTWGKANLSWSVVMEELLHAAELAGHETVFLSTNGYEGMRYYDSAKGLLQPLKAKSLLSKHGAFDLDITYTVPENFHQRFLINSKCRVAIYNYESSVMPDRWRGLYGQVDYVAPSSQYVADMFIRNGCPRDKVVVVPHGIDRSIFNESVPPIKLPTEKKFKFLCVAEPHYRKQLDRLLEVYAKTFTSKDDVSLILKTKIFDRSEVSVRKEYEQDLVPVLSILKKKYGDQLPEIKILSKRIPDIAGLYTACNAFVLMTASEGWGMPYLEAMACGLPVIAPRHGGQLEFLNDSNSILTACGTRKARLQEQYWGGTIGATVGDPDERDFSEKMRSALDDPQKFDYLRSAMAATADRLTWASAMGQICRLAE